MRGRGAVALLLALGGCSGVIPARQAGAHAWRLVTVRGTVLSVHDRDKVVYLDLDGPPGHAPLVLAVYPQAVDVYGRGCGLSGAQVTATGQVRLAGGQAIIVVNRPRQMTVRK